MINSALHLLSAASEGRVFGLDQQTLIEILIQLLNACILAAVLGFVLYKPVRKFMKNRTDRISGQIKDAQNKMTEAGKVRAEYEQKLQEIEDMRAAALEQAKQEAAALSKSMLEEARREVAELRSRAHESIQSERQRLEKETKQHIIEVSSLMATKFVTNSMDSAQQDKLFEETIAELEEAVWAG